MACTIDFRYLDEGLGGAKNKRKRPLSSDAGSDGQDSMDLDAAPPSKRAALPSADDPDHPTPAAAALGRPSYDGVIAGRVSGRRWKQPRAQRASAARVSRRTPSLEARAREKDVKRAFRERVNELKEEIRQNKVEKRKKREEREKKKQENILRSGTKLQKITNPKTLKKIAKSKQRKLLKVVPDELLGGQKKKTELPEP